MSWCAYFQPSLRKGVVHTVLTSVVHNLSPGVFILRLDSLR
jgi:hypothetical protein